MYMEFSQIYDTMTIPMNECLVVEFGIPPVPGDEINMPVDFINVKMYI
jgi:hypothetical protein